MTYSIPISVAMRAALSDSTKRYLKVTITHDGPIVFYPTKISGNVSEEYQSWNIQLKNYGEYTEGLFAGDLATVSFSHDGAEWITIMTGYVSPEGMNREQGFVSDDIVSFDLVDRTKGKGTKRKPSSTVFAALKICDPSDTSNSILHRLGSLMGITSFEVGLIQDVKDIIVLGEQVVWSELKLLRDAYKASMYFDYLGRLRFHSPLEIGWTDPESEWTFIADPSHELDSSSSRVIGKVRRTYNQVSCNRATSTLNLFEQRSSRVIYRDTTNWNSDLSQCSIVIQPGATYPENGVLSLSYKDPSTGEEYPYATSVQTPSIGQSKNYDICYAGGRLSLVSFNGSDSMTTQQPGASQIILKNTGSLSCEIIKFEIRGIPFLQLSENKVEEIDSSITDEVDYVDLAVEGKYATSVDQIDKVLARHVEEGKIRTRHFSFATIFLPQIQREMACTYIDTDGSEIPCKVITYSHKSSGRTLDSMRTYVELDELLSYEPVYNPRIQTSNPSSPVPIPGTPGDRVVTQFTLGDESGPFPTGWTIGQDGWEIGQDDWVLGQDDWAYETPTPGEGQYVYKRVGTYNPATESWPSVWRITRDTGLKGDQGEPARSVTLYADSSTIVLSSRGILKTSQIELTCAPTNLSIEGAVWTATDEGSLSLVEIAPGVYDPYKRILDCSLVAGESTLITVSITYGEQTYTGYVGISKVKDGLPAPQNFRGVTSVPTQTPLGEPLVAGDYFLWAGETTPSYLKGAVYEYDGTTWGISSNGDLVMTLFDSFADLANDVESTVIGIAVIKKLIALDASVEVLQTLLLELSEGGAIYHGYSADGSTPPVDGAGFHLSAIGILQAKLAKLLNAEVIGTVRTGEDAPENARVGIKDRSGIISGPTFTGTGLNNLFVLSDGAVAGKFEVKITTRRYISGYNIGDIGPGGGMIFYKSGNYYLEVSPYSSVFYDGAFGKVWGGYGTYLGTTGTAIGTGKANTAAIVAAFGSAEPYQGKTDYAAKVCDDFSYGGYGDWFLPSKDEVTQLYNNLISKGMYGPWEPTGSFNFRSSSELDATTDWTMYANGKWTDYYLGKSWTGNVIFRAVREFTLPTETFQYRTSVDGGTTWSDWSADIVVGDYAIPGFDLTISFATAYGHYVGDLWTFEQGAMKGLVIVDADGNEYFSASDGVVDLKALNASGPVTAQSIDTGGGPMTFDQGLNTTDNPKFAGLNIDNAFGNNKCFPTKMLSYSYGGSHGTTQLPAMEVGMSACVAYSPYRGDADNNLILPSGGVYSVIANSSTASGTGVGGILSGGSVIWQNTASTGSTTFTYYFYVVRIA